MISSIFKGIQGMEWCVREVLLVTQDGRKRNNWKLSKDIKKFCFPFRCIDLWNRLEAEAVTAENIHEL